MAQIDTGRGPTRDVTLNIIPFIDLMSCLTAFLLVTAVWASSASLDVEAKGRARDAATCDGDDCDRPRLSVLVEADAVRIAISRLNEVERIPLAGGEHDWAEVKRRLDRHKHSAYFAAYTDIEIAAASSAAAPVSYAALVAASDAAIRAGFADVGLTDPRGLSAAPALFY